MKAQDVIAILPTDKEVSIWYETEIEESTATVSSSIHKFRYFLEQNIKDKLRPKINSPNGLRYKTKPMP